MCWACQSKAMEGIPPANLTQPSFSGSTMARYFGSQYSTPVRAYSSSAPLNPEASGVVDVVVTVMKGMAAAIVETIG